MAQHPASQASPALPHLEQIRRRRGLTLEAIAERTKISIAYLRAIEEGRWERLPGGIYDVSYLRQYARAIDYDEEELLRCYPGRQPSGGAVAAPRRKPWAWLKHLVAARGGA